MSNRHNRERLKNKRQEKARKKKLAKIRRRVAASAA